MIDIEITVAISPCMKINVLNVLGLLVALETWQIHLLARMVDDPLIHYRVWDPFNAIIFAVLKRRLGHQKQPLVHELPPTAYEEASSYKP